MRNLFEIYLFEDCPYMDETTELLEINGNGSLDIISRDGGIAACTDDLATLYENKGLKILDLIEEGQQIRPGDKIFRAEGDLKELFKLWRVSQTFLSMVCAIATKTNNVVNSAKKVNPEVMVGTTRKTHPGFRKYELKAVYAGGGNHHRNSLSDSILITQNHFNVVGNFEKLKSTKKIEIEPRTKEEVMEYANIADVLLLDHYSPQELEKIVPKLKAINPKLEIAVGGINEKDISEYARYVDLIVTTAPYYANPLDMTTRIERL